MTKYIDVPVNGDALDELSETYQVDLSNPAFAAITKITPRTA